MRRVLTSLSEKLNPWCEDQGAAERAVSRGGWIAAVMAPFELIGLTVLLGDSYAWIVLVIGSLAVMWWPALTGLGVCARPAGRVVRMTLTWVAFWAVTISLVYGTLIDWTVMLMHAGTLTISLAFAVLAVVATTPLLHGTRR